MGMWRGHNLSYMYTGNAIYTLMYQNMVLKWLIYSSLAKMVLKWLIYIVLAENSIERVNF